MDRFFNTAGPVNMTKHYCLPSLARLDLNELVSLIDQEKYFVLYAPRQTGKTTLLLALMDYLNEAGRYTCLYINVEAAQAARENVGDAMRAILDELSRQAKNQLHSPLLDEIKKEVLNSEGAFSYLNSALSEWSQRNDKPIVLLIDEIDSLIGDSLISVLRQLRAGYTSRPGAFPQSVILCGVRDVRDYRLHLSLIHISE